MTYKETVRFLERSFPAYHLLGPTAYKADLSNTEQLMEYLEHPETKFKTIHVAGTNGKGSCSHSLAAVLQQAGLKVGLYTSPHLLDLRERIRINGVTVSQDFVVDFVKHHKAYFRSQGLSFFEMMTGMAFYYFALQKVDVAVIEVGMGGRLDSTNVVNPDLSVITNIGIDHTMFLGDTLAAIAVEKAGIIKHKVPVVVGETHPDTEPVFKACAEQMEAPITMADQQYDIRVLTDLNEDLCMEFDVSSKGHILYGGLMSDLTGSYQQKNMLTIIAAIEALRAQGYAISDEAVAAGLRSVVSSTRLHGRWEYYGTQPTIICETAHNEDGIRAMLAKLATMKYQRLHLVYGCVNDKDYPHILTMLPPDAVYYFTQPSTPRALPVETLAQEAEKSGRCGLRYSKVSEAIHSAKLHAGDDDIILITGSIFLVADAIPALTEIEE